MKIKKKIIAFVLSLALILANAAAAGAAETGAAAAGTTRTAVPVKAPDEGIKLDIHHVLLESRDNNSLQVREVLKINNTQNKAFTGEEKIDGNRKAVLKISLPAGYTSLQVSGVSQDSLVAGPDSVITTSPLNPGVSQITLSYEVPFNNGELVFPKTVNYPTDILYVLSPKGQLSIKGDQGILDYGIQSLEGREYHVLLLNKPLAGQKFSLTISPDRVGQGYREPKSGFHSASHLQRWYNSPLAGTDPHLWVAGIIILFFAVVAVTGYYLRRKYRRQRQREKEERLSRMLDDLVIRQKRLLHKIDSLDRQNERGEIDSAEYSSLRQQYMDKLIKIKLKIKELEALEEAEVY